MLETRTMFDKRHMAIKIKIGGRRVSKKKVKMKWENKETGKLRNRRGKC